MSTQHIRSFKVDTANPPSVYDLGMFAMGDYNEINFIVHVENGAEPVNLNGGTVAVRVITAPGTSSAATYNIQGTCSGNKIEFKLDSGAHNVCGRFDLFVTVRKSNEYEHTVFYGSGRIVAKNQGGQYAPGERIPSVEELLDDIAKLDAAVNSAEAFIGDVRKDVTALKTDLINTNLTTLLLEQGALAAGGVEAALNTRVRTVGFLNGMQSINCGGDIQVYRVIFYDKKTKLYVKAWDILKQKFAIDETYEPDKYVYRVVFSKTNTDAACSVEDVKRNTTLEDINGKTVADYRKYGLPILRVWGDTAAMSKDNAVTMHYRYINTDHEGSCTMKWQGASSLSYPRKNYTITFDTAMELKEGWGAQKKYCIKANWIDWSYARNIVSAKLWGQVAKSRRSLNPIMSSLPNAGAVDGFPVVLEINGEYSGVYTMNIPKGTWQFGMAGASNTEYIVTAEQHSDTTKFRKLWTVAEAEAASTFEVEYAKAGVTKQTVVTSLNRLIQAVLDGKSIEELSQYLDIESAIDYMIFASLITHDDGWDKNYILVSYDGVKWYFSAYDMDGTFGNHWSGDHYYWTNQYYDLKYYAENHALMALLWNQAKDRIVSRYKELRAGAMSNDNVVREFENFMAGIPMALKNRDAVLWPGIPGTDTNHLAQITENYRLHAAFVDDNVIPDDACIRMDENGHFYVEMEE